MSVSDTTFQDFGERAPFSIDADQQEGLTASELQQVAQLKARINELLANPDLDPDTRAALASDMRQVDLATAGNRGAFNYLNTFSRVSATSAAQRIREEEIEEASELIGHEMHSSFTESQKQTYKLLSDFYPGFENEDPYSQFAITQNVDALIQDPNSQVGQALVELQNNPEARRTGEEAERELNQQVQDLRGAHAELDEPLRRLTEENYGVVMPVAREGIEAAREAAARGDMEAARQHLERANAAQAEVRGGIVQEVVNGTRDPRAREILQAEFAGLSPREIDQRVREFDRSRPEVQEALRAAQAAGYDLSRLPPEQARLVAMSTTRATMDFAVPAVTVAQHYRERTQEIAREQGVTADVAEQRTRAEYAQLMQGPPDQVVDRLVQRGWIAEGQRAETYAMIASVPEAERVNFVDAISEGRVADARALAGAANTSWSQEAAAMNRLAELNTAGYQQMVTTADGFQKYMSSVVQEKSETAAVASASATGEQVASASTSSTGEKPAPLPADMARALASAQQQGITPGSVQGGQEAEGSEPLSAATVAMAPQTRSAASSQLTA